MGVRIYALAKELNVDSKELVDLCSKAGISGKGSALASLNDDEVSRLKSYLGGGGTATAAPPKSSTRTRTTESESNEKAPLERPSSKRSSSGMPGPLGKAFAKGPKKPAPIQTTSKDKASDQEEPAEEEYETQPEPTAESPPSQESQMLVEEEVETLPGEKAEDNVPAEDTAETAIATEEESAAEVEQAEEEVESEEADEIAKAEAEDLPPEKSKASGPLRPYTREGYSRPGGAPLKRVQHLDSKSSKDKGSKDRGKTAKSGSDQEKPPKKKSGGKSGSSAANPSLMLAKMPDAPKPKAKPKPAEPAPLKPDIALPKDAIRQAKQGTAGAKPLQEHIKNLEKAKEDKEKKPPAKGRAGQAGQAEPAAKTGETPARGKRDRFHPKEDEAEGKAAPAKTHKKKKKHRAKDSEEEFSREPQQQTSRKKTLTRRRGGSNTAAPRKSEVVIEPPISVRDFCEETGLSSGQVLKKLLADMKVMATINSTLDLETVEMLALEFGLNIHIRKALDLEEELVKEFEVREDPPESLRPRPPIVTFLGHVDHGKTSLLDKVIGLNVVSGESGGITQHIRAYNVPYNENSVTFVDTPGHEAFTEMRARGANVTDVAVLVIAADDGIMPQTEEALSHARAAGVPIIVALNKIDLPGVDVQRIYQQMATHELLPTEWGGDTEVVKTSAITGEGIDELMETLLTIAELHEYKANPDRLATGTCLESEMQEDRGVITKIIVQTGTLRTGDMLVCGTAYGRVKAIHNTLDWKQTFEEAGPSMPVNITGLDEAPSAGEPFYVVPDIAQAREVVEKRRFAQRGEDVTPEGKVMSLEALSQRLGEEEKQNLNLIIRADTRGSLEAIRKELSKLDNPEVELKFMQELVGGITEGDVHLAEVSKAIILGFNVVPDDRARSLAKQKGVEIRRYSIIYEITEHIKQAIERQLKPEQRTIDLGIALVQRIFTISRIGTIAGCRITEGLVERGSRVRLIRDSRVVGDYEIESLRREKDDVKQVPQGYECGIKLSGYNDLKEGDMLEAYKTEEVARTL